MPYPAGFCAALLNSQPMGFYAPAQLVRDAREHGIEVLPIDVNSSGWNCTLENGSVRLGVRMAVGMRKSEAFLIEQAQPFRSMAEFCRSGVSSATVERLARADTFGSLALSRRDSLWQSLLPPSTTPMFSDVEEDEPPIELRSMGEQQEVFADYETAGLSLKAHPIKFFRERLDQLRVVPSRKLAEMPDGCHVRVGGLVLVRQRPGTAKGITFVTIEDETGVANLIIRMDVWEKFHSIAKTAPAFIAGGRLQNQQGVIHVLVSRLENLNEAIKGLRSSSRIFTESRGFPVWRASELSGTVAGRAGHVVRPDADGANSVCRGESPLRRCAEDMFFLNSTLARVA
jgi:error-prone DNA polymerase